MNLFGELFSDYDAFSVAPSGGININSVVIGNGQFDSLLVSNSISDFGKFTLPDWNADTAILAKFDGSITGGNIDYKLGSIQYLRLKRREVGANNWITLYQKSVSVKEDLSFAYIDYYGKGRGTQYEYCTVPVVNGVEQSMDIVTVSSTFDGAVITDGETTYHVLFDASITSTTKNRNCGAIVTLNSKYPFVFFGSRANYDTGSFSATVLKTDSTNDSVDFDGSVAYRNELSEWLTNGSPKILKLYDGRIWMIEVNGNVTADSSEHPDKVKFSFDFIEIGSVESSSDMHSNGFINADIEGS